MPKSSTFESLEIRLAKAAGMQGCRVSWSGCLQCSVVSYTKLMIWMPEFMSVYMYINL